MKEISAQKLCAGTVSKGRHAGREGFMEGYLDWQALLRCCLLLLAWILLDALSVGQFVALLQRTNNTIQ
jgi:hypothetical protein